mmetsp:Transcript_18304/g.53350  ORF Transcript_18304/g.53350 Transcript_18304/m.53350 type:complete len:338 (-) Transcript_18304:3233-4246(-)
MAQVWSARRQHPPRRNPHRCLANGQRARRGGIRHPRARAWYIGQSAVGPFRRPAAGRRDRADVHRRAQIVAAVLAPSAHDRRQQVAARRLDPLLCHVPGLLTLLRGVRHGAPVTPAEAVHLLQLHSVRPRRGWPFPLPRRRHAGCGGVHLCRVCCVGAHPRHLCGHSPVRLRHHPVSLRLLRGHATRHRNGEAGAPHHRSQTRPSRPRSSRRAESRAPGRRASHERLRRPRSPSRAEASPSGRRSRATWGRGICTAHMGEDDRIPPRPRPPLRHGAAAPAQPRRGPRHRRGGVVHQARDPEHPGVSRLLRRLAARGHSQGSAQIPARWECDERNTPG